MLGAKATLWRILVSFSSISSSSISTSRPKYQNDLPWFTMPSLEGHVLELNMEGLHKIGD